tara:strand:+ start:32173 stop:34617 length:2445 start_codon:yes stop_codon:yes gene_type:complete
MNWMSNGSSLVPSEQHAKGISLILPAWNEVEAIARAIDEADTALRGLGIDYEIIVVDDGSSDGTEQVVSSLAKTNLAVRLIRHAVNRGYGAALRTGFSAASKPLVAFTDSDCQFDLRELDRFVFLSNSYDVVCGYRIDRKDTSLRCLYSRVYNVIARCLLGIQVRDIDCAFKMFRREHVQSFVVSTEGFLINSELLIQAKARHLSIVEVGVSHRSRTDGDSTVSVRHIPAVFCGLLRHWWNEIQFPGKSHDGKQKRTSSILGGDTRLRWAPLLLLLLAAVFILANLGYPLIDRDETRYAEIPREMLVTGDWVLPKLNFLPYYDKPPLTYWLCAISYLLCGVTEWSARLVPGCAALATLAATMWFGIRTLGRRAGVISGVVLMVSAGFAFLSRYLLIDGVFTLWVTLAIFAAYEAIGGSDVNPGWWIASAIFCALSFLTKGPVGWVLWLPPVIAFTWLTNRCAKPRWWYYVLHLGIIVMVSAPWLIAVALQDGQFIPEFLVRHHLQSFAGGFHPKPIWFFVPVLLVAGHPWSFMSIPYCRFLLSRDPDLSKRRPPIIGFLLLTAGWCFLFFSLSGCKLPTYLLPAAPPLALMMGHYLEQILRSPKESQHFRFVTSWSVPLAVVTTCIIGVGFAVYGSTSGYVSITTAMFWGLFWITTLFAFLLLFDGSADGRRGWILTNTLSCCLAIMVMHQFVPAYSRNRSIVGTASALSVPLKRDRRLPMATVSFEFSEVPFYLERNDVVHVDHPDVNRLQDFARNNRDSMLIVNRDVSVAQLQQLLPVGTVLHVLGEHARARLLRLSTASPHPRIASSSTHK